jgi:hypothetical protein
MRRATAALRGRQTRAVVIRRLVVLVVLLFAIDSLSFYFGRPMMTFAGLVPLILVNLMIVAVIGTVADLARRRMSAGSAVPLLALVAFGGVYVVGHNSAGSAGSSFGLSAGADRPLQQVRQTRSRDACRPQIPERTSSFRQSPRQLRASFTIAEAKQPPAGAVSRVLGRVRALSVC